jgi:hypothetical protein
MEMDEPWDEPCEAFSDSLTPSICEQCRWPFNFHASTRPSKGRPPPPSKAVSDVVREFTREEKKGEKKRRKKKKPPLTPFVEYPCRRTLAPLADRRQPRGLGCLGSHSAFIAGVAKGFFFFSLFSFLNLSAWFGSGCSGAYPSLVRCRKRWTAQ